MRKEDTKGDEVASHHKLFKSGICCPSRNKEYEECCAQR